MVTYTLSRLGCVHLFRVSRILLLAEYELREKYGKTLSPYLTFRGKKFDFYIEELGLIITELEKQGSYEKIPEKVCFV